MLVTPPGPEVLPAYVSLTSIITPAQATAGSYINDNTYVGVQQGMSLGKSRVVVDHDLTKTLKARGEVGTDGDSKLGVGFEWDY